jgi:hypothetical protein
MMKKIFGTLQIFPPRHDGTPVTARIPAGMKRPAPSRRSQIKMAGKIPAICV